MPVAIEVAPHPLLEAVWCETRWPRCLGELETPAALRAVLQTPQKKDHEHAEVVRSAVRRLLRIGGYKPSGRGKPASEYLVRAAAEGRLPSINVAADCGNAVALATGLPVSVIDLDRAPPPYAIAVAGDGASFVFNASGQSIDLKGLLCLFDAEGPCANAVKDSQRTKTRPETTRTLTIVWGTRELDGVMREAADLLSRWTRAAGGAAEFNR